MTAVCGEQLLPLSDGRAALNDVPEVLSFILNESGTRSWSILKVLLLPPRIVPDYPIKLIGRGSRWQQVISVPPPVSDAQPRADQIGVGIKDRV